MKIHTDTEQYEFSHGRKPSGRGHWFLNVSARRGYGWTSETVQCPCNMTLSQARAWAVKEMKNMVSGIEEITVEVMP